MAGHPTTIAPEVIACIAEGRAPSIDELQRVADRVRADLAGAGSAFAWGNAESENSAHLVSLRAAQAALVGTAKG